MGNTFTWCFCAEVNLGELCKFVPLTNCKLFWQSWTWGDGETESKMDGAIILTETEVELWLVNVNQVVTKLTATLILQDTQINFAVQLPGMTSRWYLYIQYLKLYCDLKKGMISGFLSLTCDWSKPCKSQQKSSPHYYRCYYSTKDLNNGGLWHRGIRYSGTKKYLIKATTTNLNQVF